MFLQETSNTIKQLVYNRVLKINYVKNESLKVFHKAED